MMENTLSTVHIVCLIPIALVVGISAVTIFRVRNSPITLRERYKDQDGTATEESAASFSDRIPRLTLLGNISLGLCLCLTQVVHCIIPASHEDLPAQWIRLGLWTALLLSYSTFILREGHIGRFRQAVGMSVACLVVTGMLLAEGYNRYTIDHSSTVFLFLLCGELLASLCACIAGLAIPRRPDVFHDGAIVDRKSTACGLQRVFFGWTEDLLHHQRLIVDCLPQLEYRNRSSYLHQSFREAKKSSPGTNLWLILAKSHRIELLYQLFFTTFNSLLSFAPQLSLLAILRGIENNSNNPSIWLLILGLGVSIVASATVENWSYWNSSNNISVRLYEQFSAIIFDKMLCRDSYETGDEEGQDIINLLANDAKRISDFAGLHFMLYEAPFKLCLAGVTICRLLGIHSLLTGASVLLLLIVLNLYAVFKYASAQKQLMRSRDGKVRSIVEILDGIRQMKLSALETQLGDRVSHLRDEELLHQWHVFRWDIVVSTTYTIAPVLVLAACLVTYTLIHKDIPASTAFTAMSLFASLEVPLAVLPQMMLNAASADISLRRIDRFMRCPDRSFRYHTSSNVQVRGTMSWKKDATFSLKDVSLAFPSGGLSVVTGPSGSGKSLILAAILGECQIDGHVSKPPSALVAYVSQTPWIQDGTVRENIVCGLALNEKRYHEVLHACLLTQDLTTLTNGDQTHLGNGQITLSGGQKWRIALARALYSNAEVILLDDLFSAVDSRTTRHLYDHALTGSLADGRTRILVTHHPELCRMHAEYVVSLGEDMVECSRREDINRYGQELNIPAIPIQTTSKYEHATEVQNSSRRAWNTRALYLDLSGAKGSFIVLVLVHLGYTALSMSRGGWLNIWSNSDADKTAWYLGTFLMLSILSCIVSVLRNYLAVWITLQGSRQLFSRLLTSIFEATLQWHSFTPAGCILNLFSADFTLIDSQLGYDFNSTFGAASELVAIMITVSIANPWLSLIATASSLIAIYYAGKFIRTIRQLKQLESSLRGPVFDLIRTSRDGIMTIRAFGHCEAWKQEMESRIDRHCRALGSLWLLIRWVSMRVSIIGAIFAMVGSGILVAGGVRASMAGFAMTLILRYSSVSSQAIRQYANLEMTFASVERIIKGADISKEKYDSHLLPPAAWPTEGRLDVSNLTVSYAPSLPPVLSDISFSIPSNTRVGVVGRTGAGKSSLALALFRLLEAQEGSILIDGLDIATIPLRQLRRRLAIVPQDPILFSGTIRSNLDPFAEYTDSELLSALARVHWTPDDMSHHISVRSLWTDATTDDIELRSHAIHALDEPVQPGGHILSQGERQRLHLGRAILSRPKILVLDEATSAVDKTTDTVLQNVIREDFGRNHSTLLVIAHRLATVVEFDRILVLDQGRVVEFGSPRELIQQDGVFRALVEGSVDRDHLIKIIDNS